MSSERHSDWHMDAGLAERYADGRVTAVLAASVEQHLVACGRCRALLTPAVDTARLDRVWAEVIERVESPPAGPVERLLHRLGVGESTARLVAVTPSLRAAWLSGVVVVLALALAAAHTGPRGVALFLALAPVLPMAGVAVAFGARTDPAHEIAAAAPYDGFRLLAVRSVAVVATTLVFAAVAAVLLPGAHWLAVAWLLPALALAVLTLAAATRVEPLHAAGALTVLWLAVAAPGLAPNRDPLLAAGVTVQLASLAALAAGIAVLVHRRAWLPVPLRRNP